jgi:hypothetical protein
MTSRASSRALVLAAVGVALTHPAWGAQTYTDPGGPTDRFSSGPEVDIDNVVVSNDALNINFQVNLNSSANIGSGGSAYFANYEVGIQVNGGAGGQTAINGNFGLGNPATGSGYGNNVGISTGMNFFIGSYLDGPTYSGGAELFSYSTTGGWAKVGSTAPITEVPSGTPSVSFAFPMSALGLSAGNSFKFDVWTTFGNGQSAYDALGASTYPAGYFPYSNGAGTPSPYDSANSLSTYTIASVVTGSVWSGTNSGTWSDSGNWAGGVPNATDATANFAANSSSNFLIKLDAGGETVGALNLNNSTSYTIGSAGGPSLTLSASSGTASITAISGNHTIAAPVNLMSDASITIATTSTLSMTSPIVAPTHTIQIAGGGTLQVQRVQATLLDVMNGTAKVVQQANPNSAAGTSVLTNLFVEGGGSVDLTNNALVVTSTAGGGIATADIIRQMILSGRITTSLNTGGHALGYADNAALNRSTFGGVSVTTSQILVGYTFAGDANLDGNVNALDFNALATNFGVGTSWPAGDFTYDGAVDTSDFTALSQNFGKSMPSPSIALGAVVPEPAVGIACGFVILAGFLRRRRFAR